MVNFCIKIIESAISSPSYKKLMLHMCRSSHPAYGDDAVGYVEVKREQDDGNARMCIVRARVTPEHRVSSKAYTVTVTVNEDSNVLASAECLDCAASSGGCKHTVALIAWLSRRTEDPSPTEVRCYWKKAKLSCVGASLKFLPVKDLGKSVAKPSIEKSGNFLSEVVDYVNENNINLDSNLIKYQRTLNITEQLGVDQMLSEFISCNAETGVDNFLVYCQSIMTEDACSKLEDITRNQAKCSLWHHAKYARVTASKLYEAAHCHTPDGSFVERLLGAKLKQTKAMKRGIKLENLVIEKLKEILHIDSVGNVGLVLTPEFPVFGASPDGIVGTEAVVEIKCPASPKACQTYISEDGQIAPRYNAQIQLQMLMTHRKKGYFCVASPDFTETGHVEIVEVSFDQEYVLDLVSRALQFWKLNVYSKLIRYYKDS